jgi:hypothetical protein
MHVYVVYARILSVLLLLHLLLVLLLLLMYVYICVCVYISTFLMLSCILYSLFIYIHIHPYIYTYIYIHQQIWWSSPISGPRRYDFEAASPSNLQTAGWYVKKKHTDDAVAEGGAGSEILITLRDEMHVTTGVLLDFTPTDDE